MCGVYRGTQKKDKTQMVSAAVVGMLMQHFCPSSLGSEQLGQPAVSVQGHSSSHESHQRICSIAAAEIMFGPQCCIATLNY